ncbi:hypothetical protein [Streptomyces sp. NPDC126503]|uniref:hypothetical protein n=1 Tax=Streptomyces sp. NPDC126503 TaxID=3155315 RepID=UPI0033200396
MAGDDPDLAAPEGALELIAQGIDKAHRELGDLTVGQQAVTGRGFSGLALSGMQLGHQGLADEFTAFCDRWGWGVRDLMQRANVFAAGLGVSAGAFAEQERYLKDTFKIATNAAVGNPHLSEGEVSRQSWDEIASRRATDGADYSAESFRQSWDEIGRTWRDTGYEVQDGMLDSLRRSGALSPAEAETLGREAREQFEPSDEAVRRAQEPGWGDR